MSPEDKAALAEKRKNKRSAFAWLAAFLGFSRPPKKALEDKGILEKDNAPQSGRGGFFGVPVEEIYADQSKLVEGIPKPLHYASKALEDWLLIEGVFRVSGIFSEMNKMKDTFEKGEIPDFANVMSKHSIAGLLELWFRELPEPILTYDLYNDWMACVVNGREEAEAVEMLKEVLLKLPESNRRVLKFFCQFMHRVASEEHENKMGSKNLGVVFGSILLATRTLQFSLGMKQTLNDQNTVVQYLINNHAELFPDEDQEVEME